MNDYEILGINEDSSIEEIELAYKNLKEIYNPLFNTSPKTFYKNRIIDKAYENLKLKNTKKKKAKEIKKK